MAKGLVRPPSLDDLAAAADRLQAKVPMDEAEVALLTQWSRFDARFAEILVSYLGRRWVDLKLGRLLEHLAEQPWPRAAIVIFDFVALGPDGQGADAIARAIEARFAGDDGNPLFFIPMRWPNPVITRRELELSVDPYVRAGFLGSESLLSRARWPADQTRLSKAQRLAILSRLLEGRSEITVATYREACRNLISVRQAQRDLAEIAKPIGFTRNRRYRARA